MLFASTELAARIERADALLVSDSTRAAMVRRPGAGAFVVAIAGGVATFSGPGSPLNKVAGLGFAGAVDARELEAVEQAYAERGVPVQVELSCLATPEIGALLTRRGYALANFENVLGRRLPSQVVPPAAGVSVSVCPADDLAGWLDVAITGFASPDTEGVPSHESFPRESLEQAMADMAHASGFVRYLARREGAVAGAASMRICERVAQLCGAATLPEHRRRGVQGSLLAERLRAAGEAGCDVAVVTTQPGSKSQENVQKKGFELLYTRAILVKDGIRT
jgi:ribosomal protein S18 acetylase RimI-like enzyme